MYLNPPLVLLLALSWLMTMSPAVAQLHDASRVEMRLSILEEEVSELRGEVERLRHALEQTDDKKSAKKGESSSIPSSIPASIPASIYEEGRNFLKEGDFAQAEQSFRAFLQHHADDALAANARYWLGESFYARKMYHQAATQFGESFENDPQGNKAADNLLKLAMSLSFIGEIPAACRALGQIPQLFPTGHERILQKQRSEYQRLSCITL